MRTVLRPLTLVILHVFAVAGAASAQEIVLYAGKAPTLSGAWRVVSDGYAAGGTHIETPDAGATKVSTPAATPASYFEMTFTATAGIPYRLWLRGRATNDSYNNDSAFIQFSGSTTSAGVAQYRIGTTDAATFSVEDCTGCGVSGWGWNDTSFGSTPADPIYFATTGTQKIRVQVREDGLILDQIVLSPALYLTTAPGVTKGDATILDPVTGKPLSVSATSGLPLRIMHWNTHHGGYGTDGVYDTDRIATWIAKEHPDLVSLNEIEKNTYWGNEDQPAIYKALLEQKTGHTWYMVWAQEFGNWDSNGKGNLIFSRFPWTGTGRKLLSYSRTVALGQVTINGQNITFSTTHLDPDSGGYRTTQAQQLVAWEIGYPENRIIAGDMNAQPTSTEMNYIKQTYEDDWAVAKANGIAYSAPDNPYGYTRNSRIDYVFTSQTAAALTLKRVEVVDTRDANGIMPSDHRPVVVDYIVNGTTTTVPLQQTTTTLAAATAGTAYKATLAGTGGVAPYQWTVSAGMLPSGMTLGLTTGVLSGTAAAGGDFSFTVRLADSAGAAVSTPMSLHVNAAPSSPISVVTSVVPNAVGAVAYAQSLQASGGSGKYVWSMGGGALPSGITLASTGVVSGTTVAKGTYTFTAMATDLADATLKASKTLTLVVQNNLPVVTLSAPAANAVAQVGSTVTFAASAFDADGTIQRIDYFVNGVAAGSGVAPAFTLSWLVPTSGTYTVTAQALDNDGGQAVTAPVSMTTDAEIVIYAGDVTRFGGTYQMAADSTAAGGSALWNPNAGAAKVSTPLASPSNYAEFTFFAEAGRAYRVWLRGRAELNSPSNDSTYVQFDQVAAARIGSTSALTVNLEDSLNVGVSGWGWQDNGYGTNVLGSTVTFERSGPQTIRLQPREDGFIIDQIVISPERYLSTAPGALKNDTTIVAR